MNAIRRTLTIPGIILVWTLTGAAAAAPLEQEAPAYDTVVRNGRLIDPETGRDQIANLGIRGEKIAVITPLPIRGQREIDATGLVVTPGFIDILSSTRPGRETFIQKTHDGVTTTFGLHGGPLNNEDYHRRMLASGPLLNYGMAVGDRVLRNAAGATDLYRPATPEQIRRMEQLAERAIASGATGIGFGINYAPGTSYEEIHALFAVAARHGVPCAVHARYKGNIFPETMSLAVMEIISMAAATGAEAQLVHLSSSTVGSMPLCLALIEGARRRGVDVAFDFHVWTRNETTLQSALYDEGWQERFGGISYDSIYVSETQEQLNQARFEELRKVKEPIDVQTEFIGEDEIELALRSPLGMISSDGGGLEKGRGHPRSVGTFCRFLRLYVGEQKMLPLMEGIRRITLLPAQRLERAVPRMKMKGRIQVGCDADIVVMDPAEVRERATYKEPASTSEGIRYVLVNGSLILDMGRPVENRAPGQWLRHSCREHNLAGASDERDIGRR